MISNRKYHISIQFDLGVLLNLLLAGALGANVATVGGTCTAADTCTVNGAVCVISGTATSGTCQCNDGYTQNGQICCKYLLAEVDYMSNYGLLLLVISFRVGRACLKIKSTWRAEVRGVGPAGALTTTTTPFILVI